MSIVVHGGESSKNFIKNSIITKTCASGIFGNWTEIQKLIATDGSANDYFSYSLANDDNTVIIGAYGDDDFGQCSGAAYIFTRDNETTWKQQAKLVASDAQEDAWFGYSVCLADKTALIGAPFNENEGIQSGSAYIFTWDGSVWTEQQKLNAPDGAEYERFGRSVSLSVDTAVIGSADFENGEYAGAVYVFIQNDDGWNYQAKLLASDGMPYDWFGSSVSIDGDIILIGAPAEDGNGYNSGSAYVFIRKNNSWCEQAKLLGSNATAEAVFGWSVCLSGDTALVGAWEDDTTAPSAGAAYVFTRSNDTWTQQAQLLASDGGCAEYFGMAVSLSGDIALIGTPGDHINGSYSGSAYLFRRQGTLWTEEARLIPSDSEYGAGFGCGIHLYGTTALIGAYRANNSRGSAYIFIDITGPPKLTYNYTYRLGLSIQNIKSGLGISLDISNNGDINATNIKWQITVTGGYLENIKKTTQGSITIPVGETRTVRTGLFLGFGPIKIIAKVINVEKIVNGIQFFIFSFIGNKDIL